MQESGRNEQIDLDDTYKQLLTTAYEKCGNVTEIYAKTFHLGTMLMTPERQRAIWAIYLWCRRTDELVDGPNSTHITPTALDRWEERLQQIFEGRPYDLLDAALSDTVSMFPLGIQPFIDMIEGMRMDLHKSRYETFEELYLYCYRVAGDDIFNYVWLDADEFFLLILFRRNRRERISTRSVSSVSIGYYYKRVDSSVFCINFEGEITCLVLILLNPSDAWSSSCYMHAENARHGVVGFLSIFSSQSLSPLSLLSIQEPLV